MKLIDNPKGNYRFLTGIAPYSAGVVAMSGHEIVHATVRRPLPYRDGFDLIDQQLASLGLPRQSLCAIELRSPKPMVFDGFTEFNAGYQELLTEWDLLVDGQNPIARTNVAPELRPPTEPSLHAFSYAIPNPGAGPSFVAAGCGEITPDDLRPEAIVRFGETSDEALRDKAAFVMEHMDARVRGLEGAWSDVTTVDVYTVHPLQALLADVLLPRMEPSAINSVEWCYSRPPILDIEFEMDLRAVRHEIRIG